MEAGPLSGDTWGFLPSGWGIRESALVLAEPGTIGGYLLPAIPRVWTDRAAMPRLSLTLVLSRQPSPGEVSVYELIQQGQLSLALDFRVPDDVLNQLPDGDYRPLFARRLDVWLERSRPGPSVRLGAAEGAGENPIVALTVALTRADALGVLAAIDGERSGLGIRVHIGYRTAPNIRAVRLTGSWASVFDAIAVVADHEGTLGYRALAGRFASMLGTRVLEAMDSGRPIDPGSIVDPAPLFAAFLSISAFILDRLSPELRREDPENLFRLRSRPGMHMPLSVDVRVLASEEGGVDLGGPLEAVIGTSLTGVPRDRFVHLVGPTDDGGLGQAPRLVTRSGTRTHGSGSVELAATNESLRSLALVGTPDAHEAPSAHRLIASGLLGRRLGVIGTAAMWAADDLVLNLPSAHAEPPAEPLPVVDDPAAPLWADRKDPRSFWYAPSFEILRPEPAADPASSPFLFDFRQRGVVASPNPSPGLEGTIAFVIRPGMNAATRDALAALGNPPVRAVPLGNVSIAFELPFREQGTGITKTQQFPAEVETGAGGDVIATVRLLDEWVRLAYGALAYEGFQSQAPQIRLGYVFKGYRPVPLHGAPVNFGGKIVASSLMVLETERRGTSRSSRPIAAFATAPVLASLAATSHFAVAVAPELVVAPAVNDAVAQTDYGIQTLVRENRMTAVFPCSELGAFYRRSTSEGDETTIIGCQDALRLGEVEYRQYQELPELRSSVYRVLRSLQQPARFLLVPAAYRITRYGPEEPSDVAYRPAVLIYAILSSSPDEARYVLAATMQPDIAPYLRRDLSARLKALTPSGEPAILDLPTDPAVQAQLRFRWAVPAEVGDPTVLAGWDGFRVSVSAGLADALLLTSMMEASGLQGNVSFVLPDGQEIESALVLDTTVVGPWESGPVEVASAADTILLTNRCERRVSVSELELEDDSGSVRRIPVNASLEPGAHLEIAATAGDAVAYPVYSLAPGPLTLQELNGFVEDVDVSLVFINLVNFANHELASMEVGARLKGDEHVETAALAEGARVPVQLRLPLTAYLQRQVIEYHVTTTATDGGVETSPWIAWELEKGTVISIAWEVIA